MAGDKTKKAVSKPMSKLIRFIILLPRLQVVTLAADPQARRGG